jgi:PAS domain-containing protein
MEAPNWLGHPFAAEILALPKSQHFTNNDDRHALAQAMVDTIREPLLVLDKDLRVITANRSFYLMFRMNRQDVQGRPVYALCASRDCPHRQEAFCP